MPFFHETAAPQGKAGFVASETVPFFGGRAHRGANAEVEPRSSHNLPSPSTIVENASARPARAFDQIYQRLMPLVAMLQRERERRPCLSSHFCCRAELERRIRKRSQFLDLHRRTRRILNCLFLTTLHWRCLRTTSLVGWDRWFGMKGTDRSKNKTNSRGE